MNPVPPSGDSTTTYGSCASLWRQSANDGRVDMRTLSPEMRELVEMYSAAQVGWG